MEKDIIPQQDLTTSIDGQPSTVSLRNYQEWGTNQAGKVDGDPDALFACLEATHIKARKTVAENDQLQQNRKTQLQNQIVIFEQKKEDLDNKINSVQSKLDHEERKIEALKSEINDWALRPEEMLKKIGKEAYDKLTFRISGVILLLLTAYLFIFYISASYSAIFRVFTPEDTAIVNSIFDTQALYKAYSESITTLLFVLLFTAILLGLAFAVGWLIRKRQKLILAVVVFITLALDFLIAYQIVDGLYYIKRAGSFQEMPEMTVGMALSEVNFWLILFLGFVVSIMLSLIYYAFAEEYEKRNAVTYGIKKRQEKIEKHKDECKRIKDKLQELETQKKSVVAKIKNRQYELSGIIIKVSDIKEHIGDFFTGWVSFLKNAGKEKDIEECKKIKEDFIANLENNALFYTNVSN
ncbi:MAG: hypothetical protein FWC34_00125 [Bacteroidetes bacterium]|nr:hypothetical protein [Bacteroidota bacterium]